MLYGHIENAEEKAYHLARLREVQDEAGGVSRANKQAESRFKDAQAALETGALSALVLATLARAASMTTRRKASTM